jgi:hypothetical protein
MADEEVEIEISPDGKVTVRTKGIKGERCLDVAELFARIVGREESRQLTSEYYEQTEEVHGQVHVSRHLTGDS